MSFVVPCFKLGHLLAECIESILGQTYSDFELLIMDDCSPDNTETVARSFSDNRIRYLRNESNLGHIRNYNMGIKLSKGKYIWLISADDRLRRTYVLSRYVKILENYPRVGFIFCSGVGLHNGVETELLQLYYYGPDDIIFEGSKFISRTLRDGKGVLAPAVMVRRDCYERISLFPIDMPHQGDKYLWFAWALAYDVAYCSDPMVNYRSHDLNMSDHLTSSAPNVVFSDEVNVLWKTLEQVKYKGLRRLSRQLEYAIGARYSKAAFSKIHARRGSSWGMSVAECEDAFRDRTNTVSEYQRLSSCFFASLGDRYWQDGLFDEARRCYSSALRGDWRSMRIWLKLFLSTMGRTGRGARELIWQSKRRSNVSERNSATTSER